MSDKSAKSTEAASGGLAFERPIAEIEAKIAELESLSQTTKLDITSEIEALQERLKEQIDATYAELGAWDSVNVARHPKRPVASEYITTILDDFFELTPDEFDEAWATWVKKTYKKR